MTRVLVAGEDVDFRRYVRIILERAGYQVEEVRSRRELLARMAPPPGAVVWDCALDREEGPAPGAIPTVFVTSGLPGERPNGPVVLTKPFDPEELVRLLGNVLQTPAA